MSRNKAPHLVQWRAVDNTPDSIFRVNDVKGANAPLSFRAGRGFADVQNNGEKQSRPQSGGF
jgi:hypothetical protein